MNTRRMFRATFTVCLLLWTVGIYSSGCADTPKNENEIVVTIKDGENAYELIQEALIKATAGKTVVLPEGTFSLSRSLSLTVDNVTVRGQGMDKTVLSFKTQKVENKEEGAQGLRVQASGVVLEGFAIEDTQGDAIKVEDADGITFRKLPYGTTQRFNARNAASPVDATPQIRALQDPDAERRYQQQVERARALKALREAGSSSLSHLPDMTSGAPRN